MARRVPPANRTTRTDRLNKWNAEAMRAKAFRPQAVQSTKARVIWLDAIWESDFSSTIRHVAVVTALAGDLNGANIFPGIRWLEKRCNYSQHAISDSLSQLVSRGWLHRVWRRVRSDGTGLSGAGFGYQLMIPQVRNLVQQGCESSVSTPSTCETPISTRANPHAQRAKRHDGKVRNPVAPTSLTSNRPVRADARALAALTRKSEGSS